MTITKFKKYSKRGQIVPSQLLILNYLIFKMKKITEICYCENVDLHAGQQTKAQLPVRFFSVRATSLH